MKKTQKYLYVLNELDQREYFYTRYTSTKEMILRDIKELVKVGNVPFKSISMKYINEVIDNHDNEIIKLKDEEIRDNKIEFYESIKDENFNPYIFVGEWLYNNWDNDKDIFVKGYPFNQSFEEVLAMDVEDVLEYVNLEEVEKWAKL